MNYSGIDLHSNNSVVSVIDETDRVVAEKRLPNDLTRILAFLDPWRAGMAGVVVDDSRRSVERQVVAGRRLSRPLSFAGGAMRYSSSPSSILTQRSAALPVVVSGTNRGRSNR